MTEIYFHPLYNNVQLYRLIRHNNKSVCDSLLTGGRVILAEELQSLMENKETLPVLGCYNWFKLACNAKSGQHS